MEKEGGEDIGEKRRERHRRKREGETKEKKGRGDDMGDKVEGRHGRKREGET